MKGLLARERTSGAFSPHRPQQRYRADVRDSHHALISFTAHAVAQAEDLIR
jgi:hypothetical protein